jgi:hypothetical protein
VFKVLDKFRLDMSDEEAIFQFDKPLMDNLNAVCLRSQLVKS